MNVSILVPYRPDGGRRDLLWSFVEPRLRDALPDADIIVCDDRHQHDDLFNHGQAINDAAARTDASVLVIIDADTIPEDPATLRQAVEDAYDDHIWRVPVDYYQMSEVGTEWLMEGRHPLNIAPDPRAYDWHGHRRSWSGIVIIPTEAFVTVSGYDERFVGWGGDDIAMKVRLGTLWSQPIRYYGAALHLFHERDDQNKGWHPYAPDQNRLVGRYEQADGNRAKVRRMIREDVTNR